MRSVDSLYAWKSAYCQCIYRNDGKNIWKKICNDLLSATWMNANEVNENRKMKTLVWLDMAHALVWNIRIGFNLQFSSCLTNKQFGRKTSSCHLQFCSYLFLLVLLRFFHEILKMFSILLKNLSCEQIISTFTTHTHTHTRLDCIDIYIEQRTVNMTTPSMVIGMDWSMTIGNHGDLHSFLWVE